MTLDRMSRRSLIASVPAATVVLHAGTGEGGTSGVATPDGSGTPAGSGEPTGGPGWPSYGASLDGARAVTGSGITAADADRLVPAWTAEVGGPVSATPVIVDGIAYVGSYDGTLYAFDLATGETVWARDTGAAVLEPNLMIDLGIVGSAAVADGVVYVGDATASVHAVDALTSESVWTTQLDTQPNACIWSSPVVWDGTVFVGIASVAKQEGFRGSVAALDAATGEVLWQTYMVPEGSDGAGVFSVPAIDTDRGLVIVGTQNAYTATPAPYGDAISIVALDSATGEVVWRYAAAANDDEIAPTEDVGLSASPNLFSAEIDGTTRDLVGEGQKSGVYHALDRETGELVWEARVSPAGFLGGMEGSSAVSGDTIVVPATDWPEFDGPALGLVMALDAATGETRWRAEQTAPAASPAAIADDVAFTAGLDGFIHAYALSDGTELWSYDLGASASGGVAVADGTVIVGAATPQFAPFIRPGNTVQAFRVGERGGTPAGATPGGTPGS